nr:MAG TPA: hypothetical protein [Caudoviricetes sp.]
MYLNCYYFLFDDAKLKQTLLSTTLLIKFYLSINII